MKIIFKLLRVKQWIKNIFVLVPLVFSLKFTNSDSVERALVAFFAFCFISSFIYIINDIADKKADASHPKKRERPVAGGKISVRSAVIAALLCLAVAGLLVSYLGDFKVFAAISIYVVLNLLYSWKLKYVPLVDVFCIALGFVLRVYAGAYAVGVAVSNFLFLVMLFLSLFLAFGKRKSELIRIGVSGDASSRKVLDRYSNITVDKYLTILASAIIISYALYTIDLGTLSRFGNLLIYSVVFVIYGVFRYLANLDNSSDYDDPTDNLYKDKTLLAVCIAYAAYVILVMGW